MNLVKILWLFFIKAKSGSFGMFNKFKVIADKQCDRTLKFLRNKWWRDYTSHEFESYCE